MRVPNYFIYPGWQRFFAGICLGAIIGWLMFVYMYGVSQEKQIRTIIEQQSKIQDLEKEIEIWKKDYSELNNENKKRLKVQEINIQFTNVEQLKLDTMTVHNLRDKAKNELMSTISKDVETVAKSTDLLIRALENKSFKVDNQKYRLKVNQLLLLTTLDVRLEILLDY